MPWVVAGATAVESGAGALAHTILTEAPGPPRFPSASTVEWCGARSDPVVDRKPEADLSSFRYVHVTYVVPSDAPTRLAELASPIVTDLAAADTWWQREDPTRTIRFDRFPFPDCRSKLGTLDLGFLRLPRPGFAYEGDDGIVGMIPELESLAWLSFQKNIVLYDGPPLYGPRVCGTTLVPRRDPTAGGLGGIAFIWLRSLCSQDIGTGSLNAEVMTHELIHGLGSVGPDGSPNECPPPNRGHVCDSELDILHPEATLETTLGAKKLDVNRDGYYGLSVVSLSDLRASPYLTHIPQRALEVGIQCMGQASGLVEMTSPVEFDCAERCSLELDDGLKVTLVATPSRGAQFAGWSRSCTGKGACEVTLDGDRTVARPSPRLPSASPSRSSAGDGCRAPPPV